jgi:hypothetical protein
MTEPDIKHLVRQAPFSFVGTIEHLGAATSGDLPIDERTAVARVDLVLHAPEAFRGLAGQRVTVQLSPTADLPTVGDQLTVFAEGLAFGETVAVAEIARAPVEAVVPQVNAAAEAGQARVFGSIEDELRAEALRDHVSAADAVVVGTVIGLEQATEPGYSEHDPLWWRATIDVRRVVHGPVESGRLAVLYPNSIDVEWRRVPKPKASQGGVWLLHATDGELAGLAPYRLLHEEDRQPVDALPAIAGDGD